MTRTRALCNGGSCAMPASRWQARTGPAVRQHVRLMQSSVLDSLTELLQHSHPRSGWTGVPGARPIWSAWALPISSRCWRRTTIELSAMHQRAIAILREAAPSLRC
ncbi:hypothetical protein [Comamonas sp. JC664]|uniref:hypothetical protein n=1 Tax=Comamonas sp. JC664 TaxID=2801917 RepID=UPI00360E6CFC